MSQPLFAIISYCEAATELPKDWAWTIPRAFSQIGECFGCVFGHKNLRTERGPSCPVRPERGPTYPIKPSVEESSEAKVSINECQPL